MAINANNARAVLRLPQQTHLGRRDTLEVYAGDGAGGAVDYSSPLLGAGVPNWPGGEAYGGWGGNWGWNWGNDLLGSGWGSCWGTAWGLGVQLIEIVTPEMADGTYDFAVVPHDEAGNPSPPSSGTTAEATLEGEPLAPARPTATAYDPATDVLTVTNPLSPDDEGF